MIECGRREELVEWLCARVSYNPTATMQAIGSVEKDGTIKGVVGYDHWTGTAIDMHWAGNPGFLNREFLWAIFAYPFYQLKCKVAIAYVEAVNTRSVQAAEHLGFRQLCVIEDGAESGDMVMLTLRPHQCKWLEKQYGRHTRKEGDEEGLADSSASTGLQATG